MSVLFRDKVLKSRKASPLRYGNLTNECKAIPVGHTKPETFKEAVLKILNQSGMLTQEQYLSGLGIQYDYDDDDSMQGDFYGDETDGQMEFESDGEGFSQGANAKYLDDEIKAARDSKSKHRKAEVDAIFSSQEQEAVPQSNADENAGRLDASESESASDS